LSQAQYSDSVGLRMFLMVWLMAVSVAACCKDKFYMAMIFDIWGRYGCVAVGLCMGVDVSVFTTTGVTVCPIQARTG